MHNFNDSIFTSILATRSDPFTLLYASSNGYIDQYHLSWRNIVSTFNLFVLLTWIKRLALNFTWKVVCLVQDALIALP